MEAKKKEIKKPTLFTAVLPLIFMFVVLFTGLVIYSIDIKILLIICAAFTICVCMYLGHTWKDIEDEIDRKMLNKAMETLSDREKLIIRLRFGIGGEESEEKTQKEVADLLGISQSYISRLEKKIIHRLKREMIKMQ